MITTSSHFVTKYKVTGDVKDTLWKNLDEVKIPKDIAALIEDATTVAWEMLTLVPPPVLCSPQEFSESYQQVVGNNKIKEKHYRLSYYRPVMLYNAHGSVAVRGIARKEASKEPTVNVNSDTESEGKLKL